jgi:hypothetical protein
MDRYADRRSTCLGVSCSRSSSLARHTLSISAAVLRQSTIVGHSTTRSRRLEECPAAVAVFPQVSEDQLAIVARRRLTRACGQRKAGIVPLAGNGCGCRPEMVRGLICPPDGYRLICGRSDIPKDREARIGVAAMRAGLLLRAA